MSILPFLVGGAAIGGVVAFAMHERKSATSAGDLKNRHGNAEPPPLVPGSVDLDEYTANASDEPNGPNTESGNAMASPAPGVAVSNPFSNNGQHTAQVNTNDLGSVSIKPATGGPPPGTVVVVDPVRGNGSGTPLSTNGQGLMHAIGGNVKGTTKADVTQLYREHGALAGVVI